MQKHLKSLFWAGACAVAIGCAVPQVPQPQAQTAWTASSNPEDLLYRLDILDAEIADIRSRLGGATGQAQTPSAPLAGGEAGELEAEIRRLTAQLERVEIAQRQLVSELERRLGDVEFRLNELEGNEDAGGQVTLLQQNNQSSPTVSQGPVVSVSEQGDLDRAIADVKQGRFDQAEDRLRSFFSDYPGSPLTGQAWYWLAESQTVRGIDAEAARSYLNGYNSDRRGFYAPHNLYKLGRVLGKLGQINEACLTLREVRNQFPDAPDNIAGQADAEADNLTC